LKSDDGYHVDLGVLSSWGRSGPDQFVSRWPEAQSIWIEGTVAVKSDIAVLLIGGLPNLPRTTQYRERKSAR
jgi:hypothetical protein